MYGMRGMGGGVGEGWACYLLQYIYISNVKKIHNEERGSFSMNFLLDSYFCALKVIGKRKKLCCIIACV